MKVWALGGVLIFEVILKELEHVPLKWKTITYLLIDTGCRRGEIMGLKWSSVDLDEGIIVIERALLYTPSRGIYEGPTKTRKIRAVRISNATLELLRKHKEAQQRLERRPLDRNRICLYGGQRRPYDAGQHHPVAREILGNA